MHRSTRSRSAGIKPPSRTRRPSSRAQPSPAVRGTSDASASGASASGATTESYARVASGAARSLPQAPLVLRSPVTPRRRTPARRGNGSLTPGHGQVRRLAEECFHVPDDRISAVLKSKPKASKWDLKEKVASRDELIRELRHTLNEVRGDRSRFRDEVAKLERTLQADISERANAVTVLTRSVAEIREQLDAEAQHAEEHKEAAETLEAQVAEARLELAHGANQEELEAAQGEVADLTAQLAARKQELSRLEAVVTEADATHAEEVRRLRVELVAEHEAQLAEAMADLSAATDALEEKSSTLAKVHQEHQGKASALAELEKRSSSNTQEAAHLRETVLKLREDLGEAKEDLKAKEQSLMTAISNLTQYQATASNREDKLREDVDAKAARLAVLAAENTLLLQARSASDVKTAAIDAEVLNLRSSLEDSRMQLEKYLNELTELRSKVASFNETAAVERQLRCRAEESEAREREERTAACAQLLAMQSQHRRDLERAREETSAAREAFEAQREALQGNVTAAEDAQRELENRTEALAAENASLRNALQDAEAKTNADAVSELAELRGEMEMLKRQKDEISRVKAASADSATARISELEAEVRSGESERRKLHNHIQELRGNVRVFARVRPFLPSDAALSSDDSSDENGCITPSVDAASVIIKAEETDEKSRGDSEHAFKFDRVFAPSLGQDEVFTEVSEFVQSALDGYHVCLFSYGQTGSGKTHTMLGSGAGPMRGIIPRAMEQVGDYKEHLEAQGWSFTMEVTFVEIYNESVRDLLRSDDAGHADEPKPEIRRRGDKDVFLTNVNRVTVDPRDKAQFESLLATAARHRSVSATNMNAQSSRSHSIFALHLRGRHEAQRAQMSGTLNLVDLAGSERISRSGATGDRLKEAQNINRSLSCLTDVFAALRNKTPHIPFRNSKLTQLLQPALSGDGKTLMIVNLSPTQDSYGESLCSLRFAANVNQCELGRPKRQLRSVSHGSSSSDRENVAPAGNRKTTRRPIRS